MAVTTVGLMNWAAEVEVEQVNSSPPSDEGSAEWPASFLDFVPCWVNWSTIRFEVSVVYDQEEWQMACLEVVGYWEELKGDVAFVHYQDKVCQVLVDRISDAYMCHISSRTPCSEVPSS